MRGVRLAIPKYVICIAINDVEGGSQTTHLTTHYL